MFRIDTARKRDKVEGLGRARRYCLWGTRISSIKKDFLGQYLVKLVSMRFGRMKALFLLEVL